MAIVRPWYVRGLVKLAGKDKVYKWHNGQIEKNANQKWQKVFQQLSPDPPSFLDQQQQRIYTDLMTRGIAFTDASSFLGNDFQKLLDVENDYRVWSDGLPPITDTGNKKAYEQKRYAGKHLRSIHDVDIQLALLPKFRNLAKAYLHEPAQLFYCDYWHTIVSPDKQRVASQNWHRDLEDKRLLKIFIYFNDISEENGAFEYAQYSALPLQYGQQFPHKLASSVYGDEMNRFVETSLKEYIIRGKGAKYTIVFADTTGFHRGGFAQAGERKLFHFFYTSDSCPHQFGTVFSASENIDADIKPFINIDHA